MKLEILNKNPKGYTDIRTGQWFSEVQCRPSEKQYYKPVE